MLSKQAAYKLRTKLKISRCFTHYFKTEHQNFYICEFNEKSRTVQDITEGKLQLICENVVINSMIADPLEHTFTHLHVWCLCQVVHPFYRNWTFLLTIEPSGFIMWVILCVTCSIRSNYVELIADGWQQQCLLFHRFILKYSDIRDWYRKRLISSISESEELIICQSVAQSDLPLALLKTSPIHFFQAYARANH